jgi:hypothetical protein
MTDTLRAYLAANYDVHPNAESKLTEVIHGFRASLPVADQPYWSRTRVLDALYSAGLHTVQRDRGTYVSGIVRKVAVEREAVA